MPFDRWTSCRHINGHKLETMSYPPFPGIRFDPFDYREPPPPELNGAWFVRSIHSDNNIPNPPSSSIYVGTGVHRHVYANNGPPLEPDAAWFVRPVKPNYNGAGTRTTPRRDLQGSFDDPRWQRSVAEKAPQLQSHRQSSASYFLPPLSTSLKAQVVHDTAKFTVIHLFSNQSAAGRGVYQFPLPLNATVTDFACHIGQDKTIRGKVKVRADARREFDDADREGRTVGLLERQTTEIFTTTLANIPANTQVRTELSFICLLKQRTLASCEVFTLTVPTFIAPRYGAAPAGVWEECRPCEDHSLSVYAEILTSEDLLSVTSNTHRIKYSRGAGPGQCQTWDEFITHRDSNAASMKMATIELEDQTSLDRDLVIDLQTALHTGIEVPQACLETHPTLENHQAITLTLPQDFMMTSDASDQDGEIIFVADNSGSMDDKMVNLKSAMRFFIGGIPDNHRFNIYRFGSECAPMWSQSRRMNDATQREAMTYVEREFAANLGGTDLLPALRQIFNASRSDHSMDVIVLTDGQVWWAYQTIEFVTEKRRWSNGSVRFFSLGIGGAVSHELVQGIAKAGGGFAEVITSASSDGWEDRVVAILKAAITMHVDISSLRMELEWKGGGGDYVAESPKFRQSPADISTINPFQRCRIFLLFDSGEACPQLNNIILKARGPHGVSITKMVQPKRLRQPDSTIHKLAAQALLGDLELEEGVLHGNNTPHTMDSARDRVIQDEGAALGCKWSLVSKYTSLYAVEDDVAALNDGTELEIEIADELDEPLFLHRGAANQAASRLPAIEVPKNDSDDSETTTTSSIRRPRSPSPFTYSHQNVAVNHIQDSYMTMGANRNPRTSNSFVGQECPLLQLPGFFLFSFSQAQVWLPTRRK